MLTFKHFFKSLNAIEKNSLIIYTTSQLSLMLFCSVFFLTPPTTCSNYPLQKFPTYVPGGKLKGFFPIYKAGGHIRLFKTADSTLPVQIFNAKGNLDASLLNTWNSKPTCRRKQTTRVCYSIHPEKVGFSLKMGAQQSPNFIKLITAEKLATKAAAIALVDQFQFINNSRGEK